MSGRRGVVLYLVLTVLAIIGSVLALLHASFTAWNQRMRTDADEVVAAHAARGALEALFYGAERAIEEAAPILAPDVRTGKLSEVLLGDSQTIGKAVSGGDPKRVLARLLGPLPFEAIDELASSHPGATFAYRASARAIPLPAAEGLVDPILKTVHLELQTTCTLRHARRSCRETLVIEVGSRLPGVLGRFTLAWPGVPAGDTNRLVTDIRGLLADGPKILVTYHDPADYHPADPIWVPPNEFKKGVKEGSLAVGPFASLAELERRLARRGAVYLGATPGSGTPVTLRLAAGGPPLGQGFQLYPGTDGKGFQPQRERLVDQPVNLRSLHATQPQTTALQSAWVEGVVSGVYQGLENRPVLGLDPAPGAQPDASSWIRPLGTAAHPSVGLVYGRVKASWAAVANIAVDRDQTGADERNQERTSGLRLPERETADPQLANVTAAAFATDVDRDKKKLPLFSLFSFGTPEVGTGFAINLNRLVQTEEGKLVNVPSEEPWPLITLGDRFYSYEKLFTRYSEYAGFMSRRVDVPYNALLRHCGREQTQLARSLLSSAFSATTQPSNDDLLTAARWEHTDLLHPSLGQGAPLYVDAQDETVLDGLVTRALGRPRFADLTVACWGEPLFRSSFLPGNTLDLGGWWVTLMPLRRGDPAPMLDLAELTVAPGGGGLLDVDELALTSVRNAGTGGSFEPLVVRANTLRLKGLGPFEGTFIVNRRLVVERADKATHALVRGALALAPGVVTDLALPLAVVHDPALDPTGAEAPLYYRGAVRAAWGELRAAAGGSTIGRNPLRRPFGSTP